MAAGFECFADGDFTLEGYPHFLIYGPTGAGKTCLANTLPGPRYVIATENNSAIPLAKPYSAIPRLYRPEGEDSRRAASGGKVTTWEGAIAAVDYLERHYKRLGIRSVIFDTFTGLSEACKYNLLGGKPGMTTNDKLDLQAYGSIFLKLEGLRHRLKALPVFVAWVCGIKEGSKEAGTQGKLLPDVVGQEARRVSQSVEFLLYVERVVGAGGRTTIKVRTASDSRTDAKAYGPSSTALAAVEPPDLHVMLAKTGWLPDEETTLVLSNLPAVARPAASPPGGVVAATGLSEEEADGDLLEPL